MASALALVEMGQIARKADGGWIKINTFMKIESTTPSTSIRQIHRDILKKASKAIEEQSIEKRKYLSSYFTIRKEKLAEARHELEKFNQEFLKKYTVEKNPDSVYIFSMQLFELE